MAETGWRSRYSGSGEGSPTDQAGALLQDVEAEVKEEEEPVKPREDAPGDQPRLRRNVSMKVGDVSPRFRAPGMLLFGALSCIIGFVMITVIGTIDFIIEKSNTSLRLPYKSGLGYFPATVSEMVHNQESPGGRVFHTFGMMAGMCIFMSWYPIHLRNVYTGADRVPCIGVYWTTARQLLPAMGLWLLVGINTYPGPVAYNSAGHTKLACVALHLMGASMMFLGYLACEFKCLGIFGFGRTGAYYALKDRERSVRTILAIVVFVAFMSFAGIQCIMVAFKGAPWACCADEWKMKGDEVISKDGKNITIMADPEIVNTATGNYLLLKVASFVCEDVAGLALVISHLAIWYFCEERHHDFGDYELEEIHKIAPGMSRDSIPYMASNDPT